MSKKTTNTKTETVTGVKGGIEYKLDELMTEFKTKSAVIRKLSSEGHKRADIARFMNIRYQHVRNVLVQDALKEEQK